MEQLNEQDYWRECIGPWSESMLCRDCLKKHGTDESWYCRVCYQAIQQKMKELQNKISFLAVTDRFDFPVDVYFIVGDDAEGSLPTWIPANRSILARQSPALKAMLAHPMEENRSGKIRIIDSSPKAVEAFVNYLYSGEASLDYQLASEVMKLAEKYQVMYVKNQCENFMLSKLSLENSISSYAIAHMHNANLLKEAAGSLITNHLDTMGKMIKHEEYRPLADNNPALALKMIEECLFARKERDAAASSSP